MSSSDVNAVNPYFNVKPFNHISSDVLPSSPSRYTKADKIFLGIAVISAISFIVAGSIAAGGTFNNILARKITIIASFSAVGVITVGVPLFAVILRKKQSTFRSEEIDYQTRIEFHQNVLEVVKREENSNSKFQSKLNAIKDMILEHLLDFSMLTISGQPNSLNAGLDGKLILDNGFRDLDDQKNMKWAYINYLIGEYNKMIDRYNDPNCVGFVCEYPKNRILWGTGSS